VLTQRDVIGSAWSPLRHQTFGRLWFASLAGYLAVWMQSVAGAWLMTSLTSSALLVALMQTAISLPMCLLSLPAGVLADLLDRRQLPSGRAHAAGGDRAREPAGVDLHPGRRNGTQRPRLAGVDVRGDRPG
jgi:MFS family permease